MPSPVAKSNTLTAAAVITAAGSGTRLGAQVPKALVTVQGQTLLGLALQRVLDSPQVASIAITCPPDSVAAFKDVVQEVLTNRIATQGNLNEGQTEQSVADDQAAASGPARDPLVVVVPGGASRQASVRMGLEALHELTLADVVLIHDAARALAPTTLVDTLVSQISPSSPAVIPGLEVTDTIKVVDPDTGIVSATPARSTLRAIQTPQAFQWDLLWQVHQEMRGLGDAESTAATDDAALVEAAGVSVRVIPGDPLAFKVTEPNDLIRMEEALGKARRKRR